MFSRWEFILFGNLAYLGIEDPCALLVFSPIPSKLPQTPRDKTLGGTRASRTVSPLSPLTFPAFPRIFPLFSRRERRCPAGRAVAAAGAERPGRAGGSGHSAAAAAGAADAERQPRHQPPRGHPAHLHHHPGEFPTPKPMENPWKTHGKPAFPGKNPIFL